MINYIKNNIQFIKNCFYYASLSRRELNLLFEIEKQDKKILELSTILLKIKHENHGTFHIIDEMIDEVL